MGIRGLQIVTVLLLIIGIYAFKFNDSSRISYYQKNHFQGEQKSLIPKTVEATLQLLDAEKPNHFINVFDVDSARMGEEMVRYGSLLDNSNKRISKYFVCTDCHNQQLETENPADESGDARIKFGKKHQLPFLPASTFYGLYDKEHWYNGDYYKKYGELVIPTRDSLTNAIQLCATQCSQGRELANWEIRSILHYLKKIQLKINDLIFSKEELDQFSSLMIQDKKSAEKLLKSKYSQFNKATFGTSKIPEISDYMPSYGNGEYIFESGCLHCHDPKKGITNFTMQADKVTMRFLERKKDKYDKFAVPHITRYGTYAMSGRKQYMPLYSFEKLSEKQMLDLLFYIQTKAEE